MPFFNAVTPGRRDKTYESLAISRRLGGSALIRANETALEFQPEMQSEDDRCAEHRRFQKIDAAFREGKLAALKAAVDDPESVPNGPMPMAIGPCLEYAIYHSPVAFIRELLELGAEPNPEDHTGFPPLIAALSCSRPHPGSPGRKDTIEVLALLLTFGADPNQRGLNDYTALHMAVGERHTEAVRLLLESGADPSVRTRIDECETPLEMAEKAGLQDLVTLLSQALGGRPHR